MHIILKPGYFGIFFSICSYCRKDLLFTAVHSLPKGLGKLVFGDGLDDRLQALLEAVLGQREVSQLQLNSLKEKKVRCGDI
jgi:IS1 family transposase